MSTTSTAPAPGEFTHRQIMTILSGLMIGMFLAALDQTAPGVLELVEQSARIMLKVTGFVMTLAPLAIFCALASTIATQGLSMLAVYGKFVVGFYLAMGVLWVLLFGGAGAQMSAVLVLALGTAAITHQMGIEAVLGAFAVGILVGQAPRFRREVAHTLECFLENHLHTATPSVGKGKSILTGCTKVN